MKLSRYLNIKDQSNDLIHQSITNRLECQMTSDLENVTVECLKKFSSKTQASDLEASTSSESNTPRKNSGYSTHEDEDSFEEFGEDICESFMECGSCMKGTLCEFMHQKEEKTLSKRSIRMALLNSFPELLSIKPLYRTRSFLA